MSVRYKTTPFVRPTAHHTIDLGSPPRTLHPISPPETERSTPLLDPRSLSLHSTPEPVPTDAPSRIRRSSALTYTHSGIRESRQAPTKLPRWLVVVVPPSSLNSEPVLGSTLSTAPPGRFTSGILMPLFPTLYGQLAAIAKEFGLPSTVGVCVYLHVPEANGAMVPRISDEAWQLLWGHFFIPDDSAPLYPPHQLPICGRIEFDIDIRKARWYESWIGHTRRDSGEVSIGLSNAPTMSQWHGTATQEASPEEESFAEDQNLPSLNLSGGTRKHVPRPLSLLEKRGEGSVRSYSRRSRITHRDGESESVMSRSRDIHHLSPVAQEDEPQSAKKKEIDTLVRNWRASSTPMAPVMPVPSTVAPDPTNMPNSAPDTLDRPPSEIDLADYQWSPSSAGPAEEWPPSPSASSALPSVHILGRMLGSVIMTPSVATSFGPIDWPESPVSNVSRLPSPDIAARQIESAPATPATATSWGVPTDYPESPISELRVPSPDLAFRTRFSPPMTPATATSWGAPEEWPSSPLVESRPRTPDVGERFMSEDDVEPRPLSFPYYSAWKGQPWQRVWPYYTSSQDASPRLEPDDANALDVKERSLSEDNVETRPLSFPYYTPSQADASPRSESKGISYTEQGTRNTQHQDDAAEPSNRSTLSFPYYKSTVQEPYAHVWPYNAPSRGLSSPPVAVPKPSPSPVRAASPRLRKLPSYPFVYPHYSRQPLAGKSLPVSLPRQYGGPIYPDAYPHVTPYPPVLEVNKDSNPLGPSISVALPRTYGGPIYSDVYPHVTPYPAVLRTEDCMVCPPVMKEASPQSKALPVTLPRMYGGPIYENVYPYITPYPAVALVDDNRENHSSNRVSNEKSLSVALPRVYGGPIYPDVYPFVTPYLAIHAYFKDQIVNPSLSVVLPRHYGGPIYTDVYPFLTIYPVVVRRFEPAEPENRSRPIAKARNPSIDTVHHKSLPVTLPRVYGGAIYPDAYPFISPYPAVLPSLDVPTYDKRLPVALPSTYGGSIYPAAYPNFEIYPPVLRHEVNSKSKHPTPKSLPVTLPRAYGGPIYPDVYPFFSIYPAIPGNTSESYEKSLPVTLPRAYGGPIYLDVYPNLVVYPPVKIASPTCSMFNTSLTVQLPRNLYGGAIYSPVYPYISIYPEMNFKTFETDEMLSQSLSVRLPRPYGGPVYDSVYPFLEIYPTTLNIEISRPQVPAVPTVSPVAERSSVNSRVSGRSRSGTMSVRPNVSAIGVPAPAVPSLPEDVRRPKRRPSKQWDDLPPVPPLPPYISSRERSSSPSRKPQNVIMASESIRIPGSPSVIVKHPQKTHAVLHDEVFGKSAKPRRPRRTHQELHDMVFAGRKAPRTHLELHRAAFADLPSPLKSPGPESSPLSPLAAAARVVRPSISVLTRVKSLTHAHTRADNADDRRTSRSVDLGRGGLRRSTSGVFERAKMFIVEEEQPTQPKTSEPLAKGLNRRISKLDRSKFPFA